MLMFVNNWSATLQAGLSAGATQLQVPASLAARLVGLGSGATYRLTLVELSSAGEEIGWEIVTASANTAGLLTVMRAEENTVARDWPAGTKLSARLTAGALNDLQQAQAEQAQTIEDLQQSIAELVTRIEALEQGGGVSDGVLTDSAGQPLTDQQGNYLTGVTPWL